MQLQHQSAGESLKATGMQLALDYSGDWAEEVVDELAAWLHAQKRMGLTTITIEQFRGRAICKPASANAWGSLPRLAIKAGLIAPHWVAPGVQMRVKAASPKTHAHEVKSWVIL